VDTLLIFDSGNYMRGERRVGKRHFSPSGPLDTGVDVIPAHQAFSGLAEVGSSDVGCTVISIDRGAARSEDVTGDDSNEIVPALGLHGPLISPLTGLFRRLCSGDHCDNDPLYVESAMVLLFREIAHARDKEGPPRTTKGGLAAHAQRRVRAYMCEHLAEKIDLGALAESVCLSRFHFTRSFKQSFGVAPYQYLLKLRIQAATQMLKSTRKSITEIALEVGFSTAGDFSHAFRRLMHCSPREYRAGGA
jgi:AraC family transcriptional regulator